LAKDLNSGDTTTISFGIFGSLSKYFYKATIKKNLNSVFLEIRAQEADQEKTIYFGETRYCINSNSFGFENLFFHIAKDSSLSFEMKPNYRRVMTVLARGHDRIDLYIEKESGLSEYVNNYLIQLVLFYYPNNKTIQSITEKLKL
jgi:hypothetical protein